MRSGRCCSAANKGWLLAILLLLLPCAALAQDGPRMPGPAALTEAEAASVQAAGALERSPWLDKALSLLEEGNPFLVRYNLLTGAHVQPRLPFGVPYLYGGQAANHVFSREPDYAVEAAWTSSPAYYVSGRNYLYGFDCVGYVKWVWDQVSEKEWPTSDGLLSDRAGHVLDPGTALPDWEAVARMLALGDILVMRHPGNHIAFYIGTLRAFGYTAEEVPDLAPYLDYPLLIHSNTNAGVARRFAWLLKNGLPKYRGATVTDGGVAVSILGVPPSAAPGHVVEQNQDTWYFTLPDGTWLTVQPWASVTDYCWWHDAAPVLRTTVTAAEVTDMITADGAPDITAGCSFTSTRTQGGLNALRDGKTDTYVTLMKDGGTVEIRAGEPVWGVYVSLFYLYSRPVAYDLQVEDGLGGWKTVSSGGEFLTGWHPLAEPATRLRIVTTGEVSMAIAELQLFGEGEKPGYVQVWRRAEKCDLMLLTAHPDDELLWFGGLLPTYAGDRGLTVQCVVLAPTGGQRRLELLRALWHCGVTVYPEMLGFPDANHGQVREQYAGWYGETNVLTRVTEVIRHYRPEVLVTHGEDGEYGHGAHKLAADAAKRAVEAAALPDRYPSSAQTWGVWQVKKLYLHEYPVRPIHCDWDQPLAAFGGKTGLRVAAEAFTFHASQTRRGWSISRGAEHDNTAFGLYMTQVGDDTGAGDLMEHIP